MANLVIRPLAPSDGATISAWRYPPPYELYNADRAIVDDPALASMPGSHYAIVNGDELIGSCSFGTDARVVGGAYREGPLDIGIGMRPDLTGHGNGRRYLAAVLAFARRELDATAVRATVAEINERALRLCEGAGFHRVARFETVERAYWILEG